MKKESLIRRSDEPSGENSMDVIGYFIQEWNRREQEADYSWMREYRGKRLLMHMAVWEEDFLEERQRNPYSEKSLTSKELNEYFDSNLAAMIKVRKIQERAEQLQGR